MTNKDLVYTTGNSLSVLWQPGWEGSLGENGHMYIWLSPFAVHLKLTTLLILQYKIKSLKKYNKKWVVGGRNKLGVWD